MHKHPTTLSEEVFMPSFIHSAKTLVMSCGTDVPEHCGHSLTSWRTFWVLELGPWPVRCLVGCGLASTFWKNSPLCRHAAFTGVLSKPSGGLGHHGAGVNQALREFVIHLHRQKLPALKW